MIQMIQMIGNVYVNNISTKNIRLVFCYKTLIKSEPILTLLF